MKDLGQKIYSMLNINWKYKGLKIGTMIDFEITKTITNDMDRIDGFKLIFEDIIIYSDKPYEFGFRDFEEESE